MDAVTGISELTSVELELKKGLVFNTSGCCQSGTRSLSFLPDDKAALIEETIDALDMDQLIDELMSVSI